MDIYKDSNGREFVIGEYGKNVYLDEKRPTVDHLIRHKWPEEKPEHNKEYLIRTRDKCEHYDYVGYRIATWKEKLTASERQTTYGLERKGGFEPGFFEMDDNMYWFTVDKITHWWELPEVKE